MKATYEWMSEIAEAAQNYISLKQQTGMKFEAPGALSAAF